MSRRPRILLVDAYDSYSNNIVALLRDALDAHVTVVHIDEPALKSRAALARHADAFDAIVAGPGPGSPLRPKDVGIIAHLWGLSPPKPVLGVCLGHQSLAVAFGAGLRPLREPRHGMLTAIAHRGQSIFAGLAAPHATTYNSLHVDLGHGPGSDLWAPSSQCPSLVPLAWSLDDADNGPVCMAIRHANLPFWGVQYHPESICTNRDAAQVVANWWLEAQKWTWAHDPRPPTPRSLSVSPSRSVPDSPADDAPQRRVQWQRLDLPDGITVLDLMQTVTTRDATPVLLESGTRSDGQPVNSETGRFSIIGCTDSRHTTRFEYQLDTSQLLQISDGGQQATRCSMDGFFAALKAFMSDIKACDGAAVVPFWGGLVGYISYEACLRSIDVTPQPTRRPGANFVLVDRSIVVDHVDRHVYVQTIRPTDLAWLDDAVAAARSATRQPTAQPQPHHPPTNITQPTQSLYEDKVRACQALIRAGESYELCLTDQTQIPSPHIQPLSTYAHLRTTNPAPFGALLSLPSTTSTLHILSSSPERFLSWTRPPSTVQFRPIKGTVCKTPGRTRAAAAAILATPKEQAENLMIVDLIRHDLTSVATNVHVDQLMAVEEYETVYQLVSTIQGTPLDPYAGIDVLARALPPGSMTGAPKKRACELLSEMEARPRDVYSGVMGYMDVGGGGDFAVVIRTAFCWEDEAVWRIGAGGAVTVQSCPTGEWTEMEGKRRALLGVFA